MGMPQFTMQRGAGTVRRQQRHQERTASILLGALATGGLLTGATIGMAAPAAADVDDGGANGDETSQVEDDQDVQGEQQDATELPSTMLILDASGSMTADDGDASGMTRMEAARQAVGEVAGGVPDGAPLGLVVYGANVSSAPEDQEEGCVDIEVLAGPVAGQAQQITEAVADIEASGYTPIGESLRVADDELPDNGERSIILVSDGIDTCAPPPPCEVAAELNDAGVDLRLHTIGFKVDDEARADLECIAEEGGGTYTDAEDADELAEEMARAAMRGMRGYEAAGEPIEGGATPMQAPEIAPGDYVDALEQGGAGLTGSGGSEKYYRVPVEQGERVHVTATMIGPDGTRSALSGGPDSTRLNLGMITDEASCEGIGSGSGTTLNMNDALVAWGVSAPLGSEDCEGSEIIVGIERAGSLMADEAFDVELLVRTEPADLDASQMPPPATAVDESDLISSVETGDEESVLFGTSFADATPIEPGTYTARVVTGERNFLRVPVEYGQTMRFAVEIEDGPDSDLAFGLDDVGRFGAVVANPLRQPVPLWDGEELAAGVQTSTAVGNGFAANLATEVNFANRDNEDVASEELRQVYLGGEQYLMIGFDQPLADQDADAEQLEWTYSLVVEVDGEPIDGPEMSLGPSATDEASFEQDQRADRADSSGDVDAEGAAADGDDRSGITEAGDGGASGQDWLGGALPFIIGGSALLLLGGAGVWLAARQLRS